MLHIYTRHSADCDHADNTQWRRCRCPKWVRGVLPNETTVRESANTRSWEQAERFARQKEADADPTRVDQVQVRRATIKDAIRMFLEELFRRYSRLVFTIGLRILRDPGEAEEIVQDVYLYLYKKADQFDETKGAAKAWIVQVAHSRSIDRKNFLYRRHFYVGTDMAVLTDTLAGKNDLERDLASRLSLAQLEDALEELSEKQRRTLELFFFEDLELKEIAERIGDTPENVRHHYYRGLQKMRKNVFVRNLKDKNKA